MRKILNISVFLLICFVAVNSIKSFYNFMSKSQSSVYREKPKNSNYLNKIPTETSLK